MRVKVITHLLPSDSKVKLFINASTEVTSLLLLGLLVKQLNCNIQHTREDGGRKSGAQRSRQIPRGQVQKSR